MPAAKKTTRAVQALLLAPLLLSLAACNYGWGGPGGNSKSDDSYQYKSSSFAPKTIEVTDVRTGEVVWAMDIPVGEALNISFASDTTGKDNVSMTWNLTGAGSGTIKVPASYARRVDVELREGPEFSNAD